MDQSTYHKNLIKEIQTQINPESGHPDRSIRKFYQALLTCYKPKSPLYFAIDSAIKSRPSITPVHLTTLLPRATQYTLRKNGYTDYTNYKINQWKEIINNLISTSPDFSYAINHFNNSATRPARYRTLAAICAALNQPNGLIIQDWGCSLNMGLSSLLNQNFYSHEILTPITDNTPGQLIQKWLIHDKIKIKQAIGIDIINPDIDWIHACEYFVNYDAKNKFFQSTLKHSRKESIPLQFISADITSEVLPLLYPINKLKKQKNKQIISMSMVLYQLSPKDRLQTFANATQLLNDQDIIITLDYINNAIRFAQQNIQVDIYIKQDKKLSRPYQWIKWTDATCQEVSPGVDFDTINQLLNLQ